MSSPFLAVDWGTTRLRAWRVDGEGLPGPRRDWPLGVSRLAPGEAEPRFREEVRPAMEADRLPVFMAGMIGSTLGWRAAPYVDCPAGVDDLATALMQVEDGKAPVFIAPGLRGRRPDMDAPDVMRGEEVQLAGWAALHPARAAGRRLLCHPGTHAKWVEVEGGRVRRFVTSMTGELFELLSGHGVLRSPPGGAPADPAAFALGVASAGDGGALASRLFTARSRVVGDGGLAATDARSYLSGLLIGADVAAAAALLGFAGDAPVELVGDPALTALYGRALAARGTDFIETDGESAVLAGLVALHSAWRRGFA